MNTPTAADLEALLELEASSAAALELLQGLAQDPALEDLAMALQELRSTAGREGRQELVQQAQATEAALQELHQALARLGEG